MLPTAENPVKNLAASSQLQRPNTTLESWSLYKLGKRNWCWLDNPYVFLTHCHPVSLAIIIQFETYSQGHGGAYANVKDQI
jgi:hypothetical protein